MSRIRISQRLISISLNPFPASNIKALDSTSTNDSNIQNVQKLLYETTLDTPQLTTLGTPPSILLVNIPPSVPIYLQKGSLLSVYNCKDVEAELKITSELFKPWKSIEMLQSPFNIYSKLISTVPFSVLVSSGSKLKSYATVTLDGSTDWAVLKPKAIGAYIGNTLSVSLYRYPRTISKKLASLLSDYTIKSKTGFSPWKGYTFLTGRGHVGLCGDGSIYNINVEEGEKILIHQKNLLAITVNGPYDLQNCIVKHSKPVVKTSQHPVPEAVEVVDQTPVIVVPWYSKVLNSLKTLLNKTPKVDDFLVGKEEFVTVVGPRNILLQSSYNTLLSTVVDTTDKLRIPTTQLVQNVKQTSKDVLSYVTISPTKGAVFENTPDFKESVKAIEKKI
ncbi:Altered inheritance of mitochondria protein 24, mitochondrial [Scheffersomyces spartinae]|uniref:Altered inheritance of mitochondria protein 24, mitochondrial n=1 Tax=Scheffersomyces spartinae TaxID=45513 RepID=A0A9P7V980_9ASCO|nr:Altered inheritance of mitochondria protein 24, mitochondrial [Scheffersomyces spartinae]KAG7193735.1 Altered inheritance of mitochondria protein 24, mitochondrial [Scheffersomyces spartinae]